MKVIVLVKYVPDAEADPRFTADGVHVASAADVWSALACGFGGMRHRGGEITFDPRLPASWTSLVFGVTVRGQGPRIEGSRTRPPCATRCGPTGPW